METKIPRVFISYSWTNSLHVEKVISLAERLMSHRIDVILDKWELKEGQDKYVFMEQCVTNNDIDKVLLICDKAYTEKANMRTGGVGDETMIISSELYGKTKQEKFIPIIFENDEDGKPYCPAYIKSRIYIDLSFEDNRYETEYDKLLRNIHNKPQYKKPVLGDFPEWLDNDSVNLFPIRDIIRQIKGYTGDNQSKFNTLIKRFLDSYILALDEYKIKEIKLSGELIVTQINDMKTIRDLYIDFLDALILFPNNITDILTGYFEMVYNSVFDVENSSSCNEYSFEHFRFFIWECFICTTAYLCHYEMYRELHEILCHTYFLRDSFFKGSSISNRTFVHFRQYLKTIEEGYKPTSSEPRLFSYTAKMIIEREKKPIITKETLSNADILLCQLSKALIINETYGSGWFPYCYVYSNSLSHQWIRLKSKKYCYKIMPLFGVKSIEEMKITIENDQFDEQLRYSNSFDCVPTIMSSIKIEDIASLN